MRSKDFIEALMVLGNEARLANTVEQPGLEVAAGALMGHARHRYPEVSQDRLQSAWAHARVHGWSIIEGGGDG